MYFLGTPYVSVTTSHIKSFVNANFDRVLKNFKSNLLTHLGGALSVVCCDSVIFIVVEIPTGGDWRH
jgi:hypothetical protein